MEEVPAELPPPKVMFPPLLAMGVPYRLMPPMPVPITFDANRMSLPWVVRLALFSVDARPRTMSFWDSKLIVPMLPLAATVPARNRLPVPIPSSPLSTVILPVPPAAVAMVSPDGRKSRSPEVAVACTKILPVVVAVPAALAPMKMGPEPEGKSMPGLLGLGLEPVRVMAPATELIWTVLAFNVVMPEPSPVTTAPVEPVNVIAPPPLVTWEFPPANQRPLPTALSPLMFMAPVPVVVIATPPPSCTPP